MRQPAIPGRFNKQALTPPSKLSKPHLQRRQPALPPALVLAAQLEVPSLAKLLAAMPVLERQPEQWLLAAKAGDKTPRPNSSNRLVLNNNRVRLQKHVVFALKGAGTR
jgi:hypothetical protein